MLLFRRMLIAVMALGLGAVPMAALASGGLSVSPISLEFDRAGAARALDVSNPGDAPTEVQVRLFAWSVTAGEDHTAPSGDIGFSPPMFRLEPGAHQMVRFAALTPPDGHERAYRLYIDQLPGAPEPGRLQMPVRMVLPLFMEPNGAVSATSRTGLRALRWQGVYDPAKHRVRLVVANDGARRVRLLNLGYNVHGRNTVFAPGLSGYVLAGQERAWEFDYSGPFEPLSLKAASDQGDLSVDAPLLEGVVKAAPKDDAPADPPPAGQPVIANP